MKPQAINAPMLGMTIALRALPNRWTCCCICRFCVSEKAIRRATPKICANVPPGTKNRQRFPHDEKAAADFRCRTGRMTGSSPARKKPSLVRDGLSIDVRKRLYRKFD